MGSVLSWGGWWQIPSSSCRAMSYTTLLATSVCPHRGGPTPPLTSADTDTRHPRLLPHPWGHMPPPLPTHASPRTSGWP